MISCVKLTQYGVVKRLMQNAVITTWGFPSKISNTGHENPHYVGFTKIKFAKLKDDRSFRA